MSCFVCELVIDGTQEHHVTPRSRGGLDGLTVDLCASCHQTVHTAAASMRRGAYPSLPLAHLAPEARERAMRLVQAILEADLAGSQNERPMISVVLDRREYAAALHRYKIDSGCTSVAQAVNLIMRSLAARYGLIRSGGAPSRKSIKNVGKNEHT